MKKLFHILTYVLVFLVGFAAAMSIFTFFGTPARKLGQLEQLITQCFIGEADTKVMEDYAASAMVSSLGDRWSYYVTAEDYDTLLEQQENAYVGIGITIIADEEEVGFRIMAVQENGTAREAGLQVDDRIISADGQSMEGLTVEELRNIVRGKEGTTVHLVVVRGDQELEFDVKRAKILTDVVTCQLLDDGIGLITIANFDSRCANESIAAIESLRVQGATSLIFDVRNNPGGYAHEMVKLLDYLLPEGDLFRTTRAAKAWIDPTRPSWICPWWCCATRIPTPLRNSSPPRFRSTKRAPSSVCPPAARAISSTPTGSPTALRWAFPWASILPPAARAWRMWASSRISPWRWMTTPTPKSTTASWNPWRTPRFSPL